MIRLSVPALLLSLSAACSLGQQAKVPADRPADACGAEAFADEELILEVETPGRTRQALFWHPPGPGPHDLIVNLHEYRSNPRQQAHYTDWIGLARERGAILVAPDGKSSTWNAGPCCGRAKERGIDDVAFLDALVARVDEVACTTGRVYVTGIGNGGMMAHTWACRSEVPDAVVSVGGALQLESCEVDRPIPVLHYHGEDDTFIPADGSQGSVAAFERLAGHQPVSHAFASWRRRNQADDVHVSDGVGLRCETALGAAPVAFCTVKGAVDTWPGAADGPVKGQDPLGDATRGGWAWVEAAWNQAATQEAATQGAAP